MKPITRFVISCVVCYGCGQKPVLTTAITFSINHARDKVVVIEEIPAKGEKARVVDSAVIGSGQTLISLNVRFPEERPYLLKVKGTNIRILFIHDGSNLKISGNVLFPDSFQILHSQANTVLYHFLDAQKKRNAVLTRIGENLVRESEPVKRRSLQHSYDSLLHDYFQAYRTFADTVSSPGVFLYIYNNVDFGKDHQGLKNFIQRTALRFPTHQKITHLREQTLDYLLTFEIEFAVGDTLPPLQLPNEQGVQTQIHSSEGQYLLINFWSSWCQSCFPYLTSARALSDLQQAKKLEFIHIALDPEPQRWKDVLRVLQPQGIQLIDTGVWNGPVIQHWRIDSIPFNFLVNPSGQIIDKAIPADSLVERIRSQLKLSQQP